MTAELRDALCRDSLYAFTIKAFSILEPSTPFENSWHIGCISDHLEANYRGELPWLIINEPPRCLKSVQVAQIFPAWILAKEPHHQFIGAAYAHTLAERNVVACRRLIQSDWYQSFAPQVKISDDQNQKDFFTTTKQGQYKGTGIGGTLTGFGCFAAGTMVVTDGGIMPIEHVKLGTNATKALSYNHEYDILEWKPIEATRVIVSDDIYEVRTSSGKRIVCTGNHPFYIKGCGYKRADELTGGEILVEIDTSKMGGFSLSSLLQAIQAYWLRAREEVAQGCDRVLLFTAMYVHPQKQKRKHCKERLQAMRQNHETIGNNLLQRKMSWLSASEAIRNTVQKLQKGVQAIFCQSVLLFSRMQERFALSKDEGAAQPKIQRWGKGELGLFGYARASYDKGQELLRCLRCCKGKRKAPNQSCYPSHRRECSQQFACESNNFMRFVPHNAPQIKTDSISMVQKLCGKGIPVYDLQVGDNHNFFANGILVHNSNTILLDDVINPKEANSDTVRLNAIQEIRSTMFSRFNDRRTARMVLIMQRLHEADPTGELLKDGRFHLLKLPAEAKTQIVVNLGERKWVMDEGELLTPRLTREGLNELRTDLGEYFFSAQYMQEPVPLGGGEFKPEWIQHYGKVKHKDMNIYILCDPAGGDEMNKKKKKTSDWSAFMVIGLGKDNNFYLLDMVRDRLNPTERVETLFQLHRKWNVASGISPKVGYEKYGMMTDTHYIKEKQEQENYRFQLIEVGGSMAKEERIRRMIPDLERGRWWFPASNKYIDNEGRSFDLVQELINGEMTTFPRARHDDMLDAITRIYDMSPVFPRQEAPNERYESSNDDWTNW